MRHTISLILFVTIPVLAGTGIRPGQLHQSKKTGEPILLIDVRPAVAYQAGHIPGAINIPLHLLPLKKLPSDRTVIVYGDGLGKTYGEDAVEVLAARKIKANFLEGGISAYETYAGKTNQIKGFRAIDSTYITYENLIKLHESELVLVDLRKGKHSKAGDEVMDKLQERFPAARMVRDPFTSGRKPVTKTNDKGKEPLFVLIDRNDGTARSTEARLRGAGHKRVVVLAGGEQILLREGRAGKGRNGGRFDGGRN